MILRRQASLVAVMFCAFVVSIGNAAETEKLKLSLSLTSKSGGGDSSTDLAWAGNGKWLWGSTPHLFSLETNSKYTKSDDGAKYDRLKTWWRYRWKDVPATSWHPLCLISTEGDHGLDSVHTLGAFGFAKDYGYGTIEVTAGASKDIKLHEAWVGDVGVLVSYERRWGKLQWDLQPQGEMGVLGDVRLRGDRLRYNIDTGLDYDIGGNLRASYRLTFGNTTEESRRTQFLGITYER